MIVRFSQKWAKEKYEKLVREAINFVKGSRSCKDLLVKVFFYKKPQPLGNCFRGNYRNLWIHGYYRSDFPNGRPDYLQSIITLKISDKVACDPQICGRDQELFEDHQLQEDIVKLFAHEFKHYLDMRKLKNRQKWRHWEVRANDFSNKILLKWSESASRG